MLDTLITSKTRIKLLLKFFSNPANRAYLRSLAAEFGESTHAIRLELHRLSEAGILQEEKDGNKIRYQANTKHPLFPEISSIVRKYLGLDQVIEKVLNKLGDVEQAYLVGDYALGRDSGTIQLWIVGSPNAEYLNELISKVENLIHRKINPQVMNHVQWIQFQSLLEKQAHIQIWGADLIQKK